jgi:hypothetical protein
MDRTGNLVHILSSGTARPDGSKFDFACGNGKGVVDFQHDILLFVKAKEYFSVSL